MPATLLDSNVFKDISKHVSRAELEKMCDPANYLGLAGEMVDRVLKAEAAAKRG